MLDLSHVETPAALAQAWSTLASKIDALRLENRRTLAQNLAEALKAEAKKLPMNDPKQTALYTLYWQARWALSHLPDNSQTVAANLKAALDQTTNLIPQIFEGEFSDTFYQWTNSRELRDRQPVLEMLERLRIWCELLSEKPTQSETLVLPWINADRYASKLPTGSKLLDLQGKIQELFDTDTTIGPRIEHVLDVIDDLSQANSTPAI